jgi:HemY protein
MRRFLVLLLIFMVSVFIGIKIAQDPGFAFFSYQRWSVEMPLWFAATLLMLILFVGYLFVRLIDSIDFSLYRWRNWQHWRRKYKSVSKTNRGLLELVEGDWDNAEYHLVEGIAQSDAPLINYLGAAKAAHQRGAYEKRDAYLRTAHDIAPDSEIVIGLTQAQLLFEQGQLEQALAILGHLKQISPRQKMVLKLLERVYARLGEWDELLKLIPSLYKAKILTAEQRDIFEKKMYIEMFQAAMTKKDNEAAIQTSWNSLPRKLQKDPDVICAYVKTMLTFPKAGEESEALLSKAIKQEWNKEAVRLYGLVVTPSPSKQLQKAEGWLLEHSNDPVLLLTLARLSRQTQLWGKAKTYYENSLKLEANPESYMEYGRLLDQLGESTAASKKYYEGLLLKA